MSEPRSPSGEPVRYQTVAQLRFAAGETLTEHLREFYRSEQQDSQRGQHGLFLYSDEAIGRERTSADSLLRGAASRTPAELVMLQRGIRTRERMLRPLARRLQIGKKAGSEGGIVLRMGVRLDSMTAAAVRGLMIIQPDHSISTHHAIPRDRLIHKEGYLKACQHLYERILDEESVPLQVDTIELVENTVKR